MTTPRAAARLAVLLGSALVLGACTAAGTSTETGLGPLLPESETPTNAPVQIDDALTTIGATCTSELSISNCRWNGIAFLVAVPKSWEWGVAYRHKLCKTSVRAHFLMMLTDRSSWWAATKHEEDLHKLSAAFSDAGLDGELARYCSATTRG